MSMFTKKPITVEAVQWDGRNAIELWDTFGAEKIHGRMEWEQEYCGGCPDILIIETLEGDMTARVGDWIIRGVKGELYPCKPDIFEQTYRAAGDEPDSPEDREERPQEPGSNQSNQDAQLGLRILACPMPQDDVSGSDAKTVGEFLVRMLTVLVQEGDGFSPKRPFGNSGWLGDLELALTEGGLLSHDGYENRWDEIAERERLLILACDTLKESLTGRRKIPDA